MGYQKRENSGKKKKNVCLSDSSLSVAYFPWRIFPNSPLAKRWSNSSLSLFLSLFTSVVLSSTATPRGFCIRCAPRHLHWNCCTRCRCAFRIVIHSSKWLTLRAAAQKLAGKKSYSATAADGERYTVLKVTDRGRWPSPSLPEYPGSLISGRTWPNCNSI